MKQIAIASGKGGTGKTTVATNLALVGSRGAQRVAYLDCDVEEPNGHIFLKPKIAEQSPVSRPIPQVDAGRCNLCRECDRLCQFNAIVCVGKQVLVYPELCHACGGCLLVCPEDALCEVPREIGVLETGHAGAIRFARGLLRVGEPISPPLIRAVKSSSFDVDLMLIDAPPGTSCPVVEAIRGTDYVVLVTEPTPFGLSDLRLAVETVRVLGLPFGVVVNRSDIGSDQTHSYCAAENITLLGEIPDDRRLAEAYSRGEPACEALSDYEAIFSKLLERILEEDTQHPDASG